MCRTCHSHSHHSQAFDGVTVQLDTKTLCPPDKDYEASGDTCNVYAAVEFVGPSECTDRRIPFSVTFRLADAPSVVEEMCLGQGRLCVATGSQSATLAAGQQRSFDVFTGQEKVNHIGVELEACSGDLSLSVCVAVDRLTGRCAPEAESKLATSVMNGLVRQEVRQQRQTGSNVVDASMYRLTVANRLDDKEASYELRVIKGDMPVLSATAPLSLSSKSNWVDVHWTALTVEHNSTGVATGGQQSTEPDIIYRVYWWKRNEEQADGVYSTPCGLEAHNSGVSDGLVDSVYRIEGLSSGVEYGVSVVADCKRCEAVARAEQGKLANGDNPSVVPVVYKLETAFSRAYIVLADGGDVGGGGGGGWQTLILVLLVSFVLFLLFAIRRVVMAKGTLQSRLDFEMADMRSLARSDVPIEGGGLLPTTAATAATAAAASGTSGGGFARRIFGEESGQGYEPLTQT
jgi:hypothetical protein